MGVDALLTAITLLVAIIGTLLKDPPKLVKAVLILLACLASAGSIVKASKDESDKQFMKTALTATLIPSNSSYAKLWDDVDRRAREHGFDNVTCHHNPDGMTCFLSSKSGDKHATLVFNKSDIAEMYANQIGQKSNMSVIDKVFKQRYTPVNLDEEFLDKIGVLGFGTFFNMYYHFPSDYNYDERFGVIITVDSSGKSIGLTQSDISAIKEDIAPNLFYELEQKSRVKYSDAMKQ
jgi:hypothetical protein